MQDENEVLWRLYEDHLVHARHHETLRATTTNLVLAIAAGVLGLLGIQKAWPLQIGHLPLTLFLALLGGFGAIFSWKYHERFDFHMNRARQYRNALDANLPGPGIRKLKEDADKITEDKYPHLFHMRLYWFWVGLHLLLAAFGVVLTVWIIILWFHQRCGCGVTNS